MSTKCIQLKVERIFEMKFHSPADIKLLTEGRIDRCLAFRCSESGIQKTEENTRGTATAMTEKINWQKDY